MPRSNQSSVEKYMSKRQRILEKPMTTVLRRTPERRDPYSLVPDPSPERMLREMSPLSTRQCWRKDPRS